LILAVLLTLPTTSPASAKQTAFPVVFGPSDPTALEVRGSNGYELIVEGDDHEVTVSADGPDGTATYTTSHGHATARGIWGTFGKLGKVAARFHPSGQRTIQTPPRRCRGRPRVTSFGSFIGTIRFNGERAYTRVDAGRAPGRVRFFHRWHCPRAHRQRARGPGRAGAAARQARTVVLQAVDTRHHISFGATSIGNPNSLAATLFSLRSDERRGAIRISRYQLTFGAVDALSFDESLSSATVTAPRPFHGSAEYRVEPDGTRSWTGDLSGALPGLGEMQLTEPRFKAQLGELGNHGADMFSFAPGI
jgi:hypothetical protein